MSLWPPNTNRLSGLVPYLSGILLLAAPNLFAVPVFYSTNSPSGTGTLDSVALWLAPDPSESLLFITDKTQNCIQVHDPVSNAFLMQIGSSGSGPGQLRRPNGIAVAYGLAAGLEQIDVLFVVERDNVRVSAFRLPELSFIGSYTAAAMTQPMGIAVHWQDGHLQTWITDESEDEVFIFEIDASAGFSGNLVRSFPTPGAFLESIVVDAENGRALLCDEQASDVMVYGLDGNLITRMGAGVFTLDPEGIVLVEHCPGTGYFIVADQDASPTEFEIFDRQSLQYLGNFKGPTSGTDGTALLQAALPNLPAGSFYASNSDEDVHVYDLATIAAETGLPLASPCRTSNAQSVGSPDRIALYATDVNPASRRSAIGFILPNASPIDLDVYDVRGRLVRQLLRDTIRGAGTHRLQWDHRDPSGAPASPGVYFLRLRAGRAHRTLKLTVLE